MNVSLRKFFQALVAHTCNPRYSGSRDQFEVSQANSLQDPILKKPFRKKRALALGIFITLILFFFLLLSRGQFLKLSSLGPILLTTTSHTQRHPLQGSYFPSEFRKPYFSPDSANSLKFENLSFQI
jgi:hypothetical protein